MVALFCGRQQDLQVAFDIFLADIAIPRLRTQCVVQKVHPAALPPLWSPENRRCRLVRDTLGSLSWLLDIKYIS